MTNLKTWNKYTKSIDRLNIYQDKCYNILYYNKSDLENNNFNVDLS